MYRGLFNVDKVLVGALSPKKKATNPISIQRYHTQSMLIYDVRIAAQRSKCYGMGTLLVGSLASFRKTLRYFYPIQQTAEALKTEATGQKSRSTVSRRISTGKRARRACVNSASKSVLIPGPGHAKHPPQHSARCLRGLHLIELASVPSVIGMPSSSAMNVCFWILREQSEHQVDGPRCATSGPLLLPRVRGLKAYRQSLLSSSSRFTDIGGLITASLTSCI